jgi:hypothetical protein
MALSAQGLKARNGLWTGAAGYDSIRFVTQSHPSIKKPIHASRGLTLVEVMLSMIVLAFAGLGMIKVTYMARVTAEDSIHQSTALVMAQGYLEQLCRLPYSAVTSAPYTQYNPPGLVQIVDNGAAMELTDNSGNALGSLLNGQTYGPVTIYLDQDSTGNPTYPMQFSFTPTLTDLWVATGGNTAHATTGAQGTADGMEIAITFTESYTLGGNTRTFKSSVRTVYGNVATQ